MDHYLVKEIAECFGNVECKQCCQEYERIFNRAVRKLHHHPAPITDDEIEEGSGQKRLKVTTSGEQQTTRSQDLHIVQEAIEQATGIGQVYAHQDPCN